VPPKKKQVRIEDVAEETGLDLGLVKDVLRETPGLSVRRDLQDRIFKTARRLGYDFRKLKIGKRMQYRKETLDEVLEKIADNPGWSRSDIVKYLKESRGLVDRVHQRVFREEFGEES
jgi:DNA-binding LacI/PurR family transcriptional regulator